MMRRLRMKIGAMRFSLRRVCCLALVCLLLNCLAGRGYTSTIAQITDFNREGLDSEYRLRFSGDGSRYAFDDGKEAWYKSAVKLDSYYKSLDKSGYIAPWKLIPVGEKDVVTVTCSDPSVDATTVRFVVENGDIVPSKYDKTKRKWQLELPSVESGERYEVYGLIDGKTAGKLRVVSYPKQRHQVTIVQTNNYVPDAKEIESELNAIYNPIGIEFTVQTDTLFNKSWDLNSDGLLSIEGKTLFGKSVDVKGVRRCVPYSVYTLRLRSEKASVSSHWMESRGYIRPAHCWERCLAIVALAMSSRVVHQT